MFYLGVGLVRLNHLGPSQSSPRCAESEASQDTLRPGGFLPNNKGGVVSFSNTVSRHTHTHTQTHRHTKVRFTVKKR